MARIPTGDLTEEGPAYEVMYLLDADDDAIPGLREELAPLGDSLVVVGGEGLWNVHIHVDDVGAAVEAGIRAGSPRRIQVTHFAEQVERAREKRAERAGRKLVVVAAGPGLVRAVHGGRRRGDPGRTGPPPEHGRDPGRDRGDGREEVIVLPNDPDSVGVAEAAAHEAEADTASTSSSSRRAPRCRASPRSPCTSPDGRWTATSCR